ncbi:TIGR04283 family arsenosugar biosynthesis glycosyltransferase [Hyalangium gracile]|uniref:TIGR04283 family arsenosugar biosynthesis glycosyltransferase n=1 Tax=Hyalangium gracile TaxID=394092 RepID=UPI001CCDD295|nr:TIGR04283 family arsenosugar biosynthesis glycosyltransferase [Hyalangium gracile]
MISVILPVLNEERRIRQRLTELAAMDGIVEVRVVDGGSTDATVEHARAFPGVTVLSAPRGRASQMNAGAEGARGSVLLFLHADVALPPEAPRHIAMALEDPGVVAGAFKTWTVDDVGSARLGPLLHLADLRSRYTRHPYGDQALFVRAEAFRAVGGFPAQPLMEDLELSRRLWRIGRIRTVDARVTVSGRRFLARPVFYFLAVNGFPLLYRFGVSPHTLLRLYQHVR